MKKTLRTLVIWLLPVVGYGQSSMRSSQIIRVDCNSPSAQVRTITAALSLIGDGRPAVLLVSGTCHENVVIDGLDRITLQGNPTAIIDGGTNPDVGTVTISDSQSIRLTSLTITGGGGVACVLQSLCRLDHLTIRDSLVQGVSVGIRSQANITDTVIQNNGDAGLVVFRGGSAGTLGGVSVVGNAGDGVFVATGGYLAFDGPDTVQGNAGNGIVGDGANVVRLVSATITGNAGDGVSVQGGSTLRVAGSSISGNGGHQVRIGDLSFAQFLRSAVSGPTSPDVVCDPVFSATRGLDSLTVAGTTTNCPAEQPPTP